jgi:hypothetical protein
MKCTVALDVVPLPGSVTVDNPENYLWQPAYSSAVLARNAARMLGKIYEALAAIEQRLSAPSKKTSVEQYRGPTSA